MSQNLASGRSVTDVVPILSNRAQKGMGYLAAAATVIIWSCYFLSLRQGALSPLGALELTLFRFAVPGLILLPLFVKRWHRIRQVPPVWLVGMATGAGLPFFLLSAIGMGWAPVAHGSTLIPGTAPLFVTGLAVMVFGQPLSAWRRFGLAIVMTGVILMLWAGWSGQALEVGRGQLLFLTCSVLWALFTISVRQSGLSPLEAAAVVTLPSTALLTVYTLIMQPVLTLNSVPPGEWLTQLLVQGLAVGLGAGFLYGFAIRRLGAEITAAIGSLTPVCATLLAWMFLHESIELTTALGLSLVTLGVICASGLLNNEQS